jgi:hypothetical protein
VVRFELFEDQQRVGRDDRQEIAEVVRHTASDSIDFLGLAEPF